MFLAILWIILGLACVFWGFWSSATQQAPYAALLAWCAPIGLIVTVVATIRLIIPNFF